MQAIADTRNNLKVELSGIELREMFGMAKTWLEKNASFINALNVFPVPDGDTGTNMLLTMQSVMSEVERAQGTTASEIVQAMAKGALMGARGNSGVILSQIMKGFATALKGKEKFGSYDLVDALEQGSIAAYAGLIKPREGTMLTVIKDAARAAKNGVAQNGHDIVALMEIVVEEARNSVERTPQLLDVLRDAGVVDAGGQGIYIILEGILYYLKGEEICVEPEKSNVPIIKQPAPATTAPVLSNEKAYGYCTEMMIKGDFLNQNQIKRWVESQGESVLVVGDENTIKIHVHTFHPGTIIEFAISLGTVHDLKIQNMDDQHEDFLKIPGTPKKLNDIAIVTVAAGDGLQEVFRGLGVTAIVPGGQTMNPSCSDILQAINSVSSDQVIVLPNNKNIIPTAKQTVGITEKTVKVLPTRSIPQGLSAIVCFNDEVGLEQNFEEMSRCLEQVRSIEITAAIRDARAGKLQIKKGNYIGLIDGDIKVVCNSLDQAVFQSLETVDAGRAGIVSLFYGDQVEDNEAVKLRDSVKEKHPNVVVELIRGSQPHYPYIISVEQ
jgi:DAK2 domain fusion protein YloV